MSARPVRELRVEHLVNRRVRDADGEVIGRLEELCVEIELTEDGSHYVVREFHVGAHALAESLVGGQMARALVRVLGRGRGYRRYVIPWEWMDLSDPRHPRVTRPRRELREAD